MPLFSLSPLTKNAPLTILHDPTDSNAPDMHSESYRGLHYLIHLGRAIIPFRHIFTLLRAESEPQNLQTLSRLVAFPKGQLIKNRSRGALSLAYYVRELGSFMLSALLVQTYSAE